MEEKHTWAEFRTLLISALIEAETLDRRGVSTFQRRRKRADHAGTLCELVSEAEKRAMTIRRDSFRDDA